MHLQTYPANFLLAALLFSAPLHSALAGQAATAAAPGDLRARLVAALIEDAERAEDEGRTRQLIQMAADRVRDYNPATASEADLRRLGGTSDLQRMVSPETLRLHTDFARQQIAETHRLRADLAERYKAALDDLLRRATLAEKPETFDGLRGERDALETLWAEVPSTRRNSQPTPDRAVRTLEIMKSVATAREQQQWQGFGTQLSRAARQLSESPISLPGSSIDEYTARQLASAGLPALNNQTDAMHQLARLLLDDSNQDSLQEIWSDIDKHSQVFSSLTSELTDTETSRQWRALAGFAAEFLRVYGVLREGGPSAPLATRWGSDTTSGQSLFPPYTSAELTRLLQNYRVRLAGEDGQTVPMLEDLPGLIGSIKTLDDLKSALPAFRRAAHTGDGASAQETQMLANRLASIADIHEQVRAGDEMVLDTQTLTRLNGGIPRDINRDHPDLRPYLWNTPANERTPAHTRLIDTLTTQLRGTLIGRIFPGHPSEENEDPADHLRRVWNAARASDELDTVILAINACEIFPTNPVPVDPNEYIAIRHYLLGIRQASELEQPRLATFHLQQAAAPATPLPSPALLRQHLARLRNAHPEEYRLGTEDALRATLSDRLPAREILRLAPIPP